MNALLLKCPTGTTYNGNKLCALFSFRQKSSSSPVQVNDSLRSSSHSLFLAPVNASWAIVQRYCSAPFEFLGLRSTEVQRLTKKSCAIAIGSCSTSQYTNVRAVSAQLHEKGSRFLHQKGLVFRQNWASFVLLSFFSKEVWSFQPIFVMNKLCGFVYLEQET